MSNGSVKRTSEVPHGTSKRRAEAGQIPYKDNETIKEILDDVIHAGVLDAVTVTDDGNLDISWTSGEIYHPNGDGDIVDTVAGSDTCTDDVINYLVWVSGTGLTLRTTIADHETEVAIAHVMCGDGDIYEIHEDLLIRRLVPGIESGLEGLLPVVVTSGCKVSEDVDVTNPLDVSVSTGAYHHAVYEKVAVTGFDSRTASTLIRCNIDAGGPLWNFVTGQDEADFTKWNNGNNLVVTNAPKYYRGLFIVSEHNVFWVYAQEEHANLHAALTGADPTVPAGIANFPKSIVYIYKHGDTAFVAAGSERWIDVRPLLPGSEAAAAGGINNVVEDNTPQLGGNLDSNTHEIQMNATDKTTYYNADQFIHAPTNATMEINAADTITLDAGTQVHIDMLDLSVITHAGTLKHEQGGLEFDASAVLIGDVIAGTGAGTLALITAVGHGDGDVLTLQGDGSADWEAGGGGGGEVNTASNQGADGVGVYDTKVGVDLQFRHVAPGSSKVTTVLNGKDIDVDVVPGNLGLAATSYVFITDVSPSNGGSVVNKAYESTVPTDKRLTTCESDTDAITVTVEIHGLTDGWAPESVTISGAGAAPVTSFSDPDAGAEADWTLVQTGTRIWQATIDLDDADTTDPLIATMSDGDTASCTYVRALDPPEILSVVWDDQGDAADPYPAAQTQFKEDDLMQLSGTCDAHAEEVYIKDAGATQNEGLQGPYAAAAGAWAAANVVAGDDDDGTAHVVVYCKVGGGANGADFNSETDQAPETVICSQTSPTFGAFSVAYDGAQEAMKAAEDVDVTLAHTNIQAGDTYLYVDPTGTDVVIPNLAVYASPKAAVTIDTANIYRDDDSPANFQLTVTRTTLNGKSASASGTIEIADLAAKVKIDDSGTTYAAGGEVARMGTDDGTLNQKDRYIYVISDQKHHSGSTSSITSDGGDTSAFVGAWAENNDFRFRREFRVEDGDINAGGQAANDFSWDNISVTNRAGTVTAAITKNPDYSIGGFEDRTLTIPAWPNREADMSVFAVDTTKLVCENLSKGGGGPNGGTIFTFDNSPGDGNAPDNEVDKFCISNGSDVVDDDGQFWYNKDQANAVSNSSGTAQTIVGEDP